MRIIPLATQNWAERVSENGRAVLLSDRRSGESRDQDGQPVASSEAVAYVFEDEAEAVVFAQECVFQHPDLSAEVYDGRGLGVPPRIVVVHPEVAERAATFERWRPGLGVLLWGTGLVLARYEVKNDFGKLWPMLLGIKCCVLGTVCLVTSAARRFGRKRVDD
jgi:hypothetical protein